MGRRVFNVDDDGELSRESILREAVAIFSEKGYRATSLEDVAARLGVTRPSIYYYYKSKQEILLQAHLEAADTIFKTAYEIIERPLTVKEKFIKLIENHIIDIAKNAKLVGIFYEEEKELSKTDVRVKELREKRSRYIERFGNLYREGVAQGIFQNTNPKITVLTILGACSWVYRWYREDGELSPETIAKQMAKSLASGYLK